MCLLPHASSVLPIPHAMRDKPLDESRVNYAAAMRMQLRVKLAEKAREVINIIEVARPDESRANSGQKVLLGKYSKNPPQWDDKIAVSGYITTVTE